MHCSQMTAIMPSSTIMTMTLKIAIIILITVIHGLISEAVKSLLSTYRNPAYPMFRVLGTTSIFIGWKTAKSSSIPSKINNGSPTPYTQRNQMLASASLVKTETA